MNNDTTRNPDILNCLANLSSDEVFTPPELANKMLDLLPQELFKTKHTTFLDPCCKSGVFLREIAKRLIKGLENEIPDLQERVNWIMTKQLFGIPLTDLTAKMTRRTLYCSRHPTGKYSVVNTFDETTKFGNIYSKVASHEYDKSGKCIKCGASREVFKNSKEQHAYYFIHANKPKEIFKMKFDVIIGNPPYQLSTGGGQAQATPIYNKFIEQAKKLNPRYLVMITPSRYFAGGIGLDDFRKSMLSDKRISHIVDYLQSEECFPGVVIAGGVNYFLWEKEYNGPCKYTAIDQGKYSTAIRDLDEYEVFVRSNIGLSIIKKIEKLKEKSISTIMSPLSPFGINSFVRGNEEENLNDYTLYSSEGIGFISKDKIIKGKEYIDNYNVAISYATSGSAASANKEGQRKVLAKLIKLKPNEVCTFTYFLAGNFKSEKECDNCLKYLSSKFVRYLLFLSLTSIHVSKDKFRFVPLQNFNQSWSDGELYKKYNLSEDEIDLIEKMITEWSN